VRLAGLDLNLLVVLEAVLEEQNVVRASLRVNLSPSATSHALARLRDTFGDPLLVKSGRGLVRTPRGDALMPQVKRALAEVEDVFRARRFDASALVRAFRVATTDHVQFVLLPALDAILEAEAPKVDVFCFSPGPSKLPRVRSGELDCAIRLSQVPSDEFSRFRLFDDELVVVVREGHPAGRGPWTLKEFAALQHVLVSPNGKEHGVVDHLLEPHGLRRRIARMLPTSCEAAHLVAVTDAVATLPRRLVEVLGPKFGIVQAKTDLSFPVFEISAIWHQRTDADPEHQWFRRALARAGAML
jgi:DNA-binding transcriptional LysR family regulator